jgi:hypothetical protein
MTFTQNKGKIKIYRTVTLHYIVLYGFANQSLTLIQRHILTILRK